MGTAGLEPGAPQSARLASLDGTGSRMIRVFGLVLLTWLAGFSQGWPEQDSPIGNLGLSPSSTRLKVNFEKDPTSQDMPFLVPLPAHAARTQPASSTPGFRVNTGRNPSPGANEEEPSRAEYLLPDRNTKPFITPEMANLNLPKDMELTSLDTGETIFLPAGTYRQILQIPIDSPLMQTTDQMRRDQSRPVEVKKEKSRYSEPEKKPIWVRYECLDKIRIGDAERRGGLDVPSHGPKELGPRVWYAKSETADVASSVFYFVFGGLGYSTANILGWSAGNIREIPGDFEYRLIRR